jgi:raffinose/stachyose/melibiose transport system substrate-binding protein
VKLVITTNEAIKLRLQQGNPPEFGAVGLSVTSPTKDAQDQIKAGWVLNLQDAMNQESFDTPGKSWLQTISPIVQPILQVPSIPGVWSCPREVTTIVFYYNQKLFDQAGVTPPKSWTEFLKVCDTLKSKGITPLTVDGTAGDGYMEWWFSELAQMIAGRGPLREAIQGKRSFTEAPLVQAAQAIRDTVDKGYFVDGFSGNDFTGSQMVFYQGQAAMLLVGSWLLSEMANSIPVDFKQDVFRFPFVEGGKGDPKHLYGTSNIMGVTKSSKHPEWGVEYARFFNSVKVNNKRTEDLQYQSAILGAKSPTATPALNKIWEETTVMDLYNNGDLWGPMKEAGTKYYELTGKLFFKEVSPADFCKQVDQIVKDFNAGKH